MLRRKSTRQLFVAAYFLISLLPCKGVSHQTARGRLYINNPFTHPSPINLGEVEIEFSWGENQTLAFFQVNMIDPEFGVPFTIVPDSPALLQALNPVFHFDNDSAPVLSSPLPDLQLPFWFDGAPRFEVFLINRRMGSIDAARCRSLGASLKLRTYWAGDKKLMGVLSTEKSIGPIANLIAISFDQGFLFIQLVSRSIEGVELEIKEKTKELDKNWKPDSDRGAGGSAAGMVSNFIYERSLGYSGSFIDGIKYLYWLQLLRLTPELELSLF